jgi:hypothetical protein
MRPWRREWYQVSSGSRENTARRWEVVSLQRNRQVSCFSWCGILTPSVFVIPSRHHAGYSGYQITDTPHLCWLLQLISFLFRLFFPLLEHRVDFSVSWSFTDGRTPWTGEQLVARPLHKHRTTQPQKKRTHTHIKHPCREWDSNPRTEWVKIVHALGRPHTNCVKTSIKTWDTRRSLASFVIQTRVRTPK